MNTQDENEFLGVENYDVPEQKEVVIDPQANKTIDLKDLSPIEMIRLTAQENGIKIKDFKLKYGRFDTGCRNNGCWGRGYKGWNGNVPIPCTCLFHKADRDLGKNPLNRNTIRAFGKLARTESFARIQDRAKNYGLTKIYRKTDKESSQVILLGETAKGAVFEWTSYKGKWDFRRYEPGKKVVPVEGEDE